MASGTTFDVPPPGAGFTMLTCAVPTEATSAAAIDAERLVVLLVAISDVATYVLATFASLQYEEIALIYNTPNVTIEALPPSDEQLQAVLAFLLDPGMEPGGCRSADADEPA